MISFPNPLLAPVMRILAVRPPDWSHYRLAGYFWQQGTWKQYTHLLETMKKRSCPTSKADGLVRELLGRIADKWTLVVLDKLGEEELRFSRLRERVGGISQKMLTQKLRQLERDGLVSRRVHAVIPPRVDYKLTPLGLSLGKAVCRIWTWTEEHAAVIEKPRRAFDRSAGRTTGA